MSVSGNTGDGCMGDLLHNFLCFMEDIGDARVAQS